MGKLIILLAIAVCGSSAFVIESGGLERIANGIMAQDNQFPYAVSLQRLALLPNATRGHVCGGVLISFSHVLTAASCTYQIINGATIPITPNQYRVFGGSTLLNNDASPDRFRSIANITIHPDHVPAPANINDIAIITLLTPFLNATVAPIPLPNANFAPVDFALCTVAGWGAQTTDMSNASVALTYANKYVYNQDLCTRIYAGIFGVSNVFDTMICAASFDIISAGCPSDAGNALVCDNQLTGLLFHTNNCQASSFPELYTRVSNYTTWIRSVTGGASSFQPAFGLLTLFTVLHLAFSKVIV